jgi:hypothetical protein
MLNFFSKYCTFGCNYPLNKYPSAIVLSVELSDIEIHTKLFPFSDYSIVWVLLTTTNIL